MLTWYLTQAALAAIVSLGLPIGPGLLLQTANARCTRANGACTPGRGIVMNARELYTAIFGFNQTEKDEAGRIISRPVKPVFLALEGPGPNRRRLQVGFLQQLSALLQISAVQAVWQNDGIAVTLTMRPQLSVRTALADVSISQGSTTATLGTFAVTFREDFTVPQEVIEALKQKASVKH